jgi:hypothetical protein
VNLLSVPCAAHRCQSPRTEAAPARLQAPELVLLLPPARHVSSDAFFFILREQWSVGTSFRWLLSRPATFQTWIFKGRSGSPRHVVGPEPSKGAARGGLRRCDCARTCRADKATATAFAPYSTARGFFFNFGSMLEMIMVGTYF